MTALYCLKRGYCNIIIPQFHLHTYCSSQRFAVSSHPWDSVFWPAVMLQCDAPTQCHVLDPSCDAGLCPDHLVPLISSLDPTEYLGHLLPPPLCGAGWGAGCHLEQGSRAYRGASGAAHSYRAEGWPHWDLRQDHPLTTHQWGMR